VVVLRRLEGLSDRGVADRFAFDVRWRHVAGMADAVPGKGTVTCPARVTVAITPARRGGGWARFGVACGVCPLRDACTSSARGRVVAVHPHEAELAAARARQRDPAWLADYRATRPKVERKLAHLLRRRHARVRGLVRVARTSSCWPARSTWPGSPRSDCAPRPAAGTCSRPDRGGRPLLRGGPQPQN
jgi:hypothetical protein